MNYSELSLKAHEDKKGKIEVKSKLELKTKDDLSIAYTPGVAEPCRKIHENIENVYKYTAKGNLVAVVTDGTAVLGLGDIGPEAAMPVMEGKSILFKEFGGVDAIPICLDTKDVDEIVETVKRIAPTFGGINLEDISAPRCVEIENRLKEELDIPIFHDDQHGTAIVVSAGLINALKIVNKKLEEIKVVINGAGAAGRAIVKMLRSLGVEDILICDSKGIVRKGSSTNNWMKEELAEVTNKDNIQGSLKDAMVGADVFIGVSAGNIVNKEMVKSMNKDSIIFALANPIPEIFPEEAKAAGARVVGSGRSDFPNQINNVLAFPGLFRGALDARAKDINDEMNIAAAYAIANIVEESELNEEYIIPNAFNKQIALKVAKAVEEAARKTGVARA
jgi:malate dehydrogenase (oxaloacetate-decarboxylating)